MTNREMAALIPAYYRKEILELDLIYRAKAHLEDGPMIALWNIWEQFIAPGEELTCARCLVKCLKAFQQMRGELLKLEHASKLLENL